MPVGMEVNLDDFLTASTTITGDGTAAPQGVVSAGELPALIAVRLRWDRFLRKDKSLDYTEKELLPGQIVHLKVHYLLSNGETKKVFVEVINKHNGQKLESERRTFTGVHVLP